MWLPACTVCFPNCMWKIPPPHMFPQAQQTVIHEDFIAQCMDILRSSYDTVSMLTQAGGCGHSVPDPNHCPPPRDPTAENGSDPDLALEKLKHIRKLFFSPEESGHSTVLYHSFSKTDFFQPVFSLLRIRIGSGFNQVSGSVSGSRRARMTDKSRNFLEISCIQLTMLDPDPYQMNTDPKYWVWCAYPDPTHPGADPSAENGSDPDLALEILKHI
jgi:hypothetical protein